MENNCFLRGSQSFPSQYFFYTSGFPVKKYGKFVRFCCIFRVETFISLSMVLCCDANRAFDKNPPNEKLYFLHHRLENLWKSFPTNKYIQNLLLLRNALHIFVVFVSLFQKSHFLMLFDLYLLKLLLITQKKRVTNIFFL